MLQKLNDTLEAIKQTNDDITSTKDYITALTNDKRANYSRYNLGRELSPEEVVQRESVINEIAAEDTKLIDLRITLAILNNNLVHDVFGYVWPYLADILKKYEGKKAGPKTTEKMQNELLTACGFKFYFKNGYHRTELIIYGINPETKCSRYDIPLITIDYSNYDDSFLVDNTIQPIKDGVRAVLWGSNNVHVKPYCSDIPKAIEDIKTAYTEVITTAAAYKVARDKYNALKLAGMSDCEYVRMPYHSIMS